MLHIPNALIMETVRSYTYAEGWYSDVVTDRIPIDEGHLSLPAKPGLGTRLRDDFTSRPNACVEITTENDLKNW